ncbi:MAG: hypothetical protein J1F03_10075, partial [Oscillospiraceae bacterium]|nr:hypothetical protein [Oscillospiraceae bacterium]
TLRQLRCRKVMNFEILFKSILPQQRYLNNPTKQRCLKTRITRGFGRFFALILRCFGRIDLNRNFKTAQRAEGALRYQIAAYEHSSYAAIIFEISLANIMW